LVLNSIKRKLSVALSFFCCGFFFLGRRLL
jgi:hypothetical protein